MRLRQRMTETWIQLWLETRHADLFRCANPQTGVQDAPGIEDPGSSAVGAPADTASPRPAQR